MKETKRRISNLKQHTTKATLPVSDIYGRGETRDDDAIYWVSLAAGIDEKYSRIYRLLNVEDGMAVSTDGRRMHLAPCECLEDGTYYIASRSAKGVELVRIEPAEIFPYIWRQLVPRLDGVDCVDLAVWRDYPEGVIAKVSAELQMPWAANREYLIHALAMDENPRLRVRDSVSPALIEKNGRVAVVMPIRV